MSKWYGSLQNRLEENHQFCPEITVGTGMTEYLWSDRHAYEVVEVRDQKHVTVREYDHKHIGTEWYDNDWELISNPEKPTRRMEMRGKYWYWVYEAPDGTKSRSRANVSFGVAEYYYDPSF